MEAVLKGMNNSTALGAPLDVLKDLGIGVGQRLTLATTADGKIDAQAGVRFGRHDRSV